MVPKKVARVTAKGAQLGRKIKIVDDGRYTSSEEVEAIGITIGDFPVEVATTHDCNWARSGTRVPHEKDSYTYKMCHNATCPYFLRCQSA